MKLFDTKVSINNCSIMSALVIISNILIPKAGIKYAGIPITIGSLMLAFFVFYAFIKNRYKKIPTDQFEVMVVLGILYWIVVFTVDSISSSASPSLFVGYLVPLVVFPLTYFAFYWSLNYCDVERCVKIVTICVYIIMGYSILQYFFGISETAIPGITVNYSDYCANPTDWWLEKCNDIGGGTKIFSTYQNGNIFGVNILLLFPITYRYVKNGIAKGLSMITFCIVCFLTGSRTILLGLAVYFCVLIARIIVDKKIKKNKILFGMMLAAAIPMLVVFILNSKKSTALLSRLNNSLNIDVFLKGAGRTDGALYYFRWLKENMVSFLFGGFGRTYSGGAYEMTYIAIFVLGGIVGLILFILPILNSLLRCNEIYSKKGNFIALGIFEGLLVYSVAAFIEGAYWLPPTAINVWMVIALGNVLFRERNKNESWNRRETAN